MRLWYQSLTRQDAWPAYNATLRRVLAGVADPGTSIEVHGIRKVGGIGDQYRYLEFLETAEVLENVQRADREGFDAFLIGNIGDPGLREARELARIPVLGLCETSLHIACMMGASFALVTANEKFTPRIVENVRRYGLESRLAGVQRMTVERLVDLDAGFVDPAARERLTSEFRSAAARAAAAGAEVVIPCVGVLMALLADAGIHTAGQGAPVLNGIVALVKTGEAVARMHGLMGGRFTSRRAAYAQPPSEQIDELRRFYGQVYSHIPSPSGTPEGGRP
ncbi:MAG TPA: aspartate/glutamate racemase family protein [Thermodesulfobacteriota bacterium]